MTQGMVIVVDTRNSALGIVAERRALKWNCGIIYADDFISPRRLLSYLRNKNYARVFFAWRGFLWEGFYLRGFYKDYCNLIKSAELHLLVPDLMGLEERFRDREELVISAVHGYSVTSEHLFAKYKGEFSAIPPSGILHDLPNIELIRNARSLDHEGKRIIWVGNSKWGENHGYHDYKGFNKVIKPLITLFQKMRLDFHFDIVDSAFINLPNSHTIKRIACANILILSSEQEGTGLPILEALGVGTLPITTKVGISEEVLKGELSDFIVRRDYESFATAILKEGETSGQRKLECISAFEAFVANVENETIHWGGIPLAPRAPTFDSYEKYLVLGKWILRYLRGLRQPKSNHLG